jgi:hypothetical protein
MNKTLINIFLFTTGAAVGSMVTWKIAKTRYERMIQEEVDAFKEDYVRCMRGDSGDDIPDDDEGTEEDEEEDSENPDAVEYHGLAHMYDQSGDEAENDEEGAGNEEVPYINGPYVIQPEDFGDGNYDHSMYSLAYYSDGVLSNDWLEQLDIDETIGEESLKHFGDHVEDVVHVRNERLNADYEVVRDPRTYAEMVTNDSLMHAHANRGAY